MTTLTHKRHQIESAIENYKQRLDQARADLSHVNAVIALFEVNDDSEGIRPYTDIHRLYLVAVVVTTAAVVTLTRQENEQAKSELEQYKSEAARTIAQTEERAEKARAEAARANESAEALRGENLKLQARLAPRMLTAEQQSALSKSLANAPKQSGHVRVSPSTPETESFARVLTPALRMAGWEMTIEQGLTAGMPLFTTGVLIQFRVETRDVGHVDDLLDRSRSLALPGSGAAVRLAEALNALGIEAKAAPGFWQTPETMQIIITPR